MTDQYDDPTALAALVTALSRPLLIGLDVDGVLAPIVRHPDEATLLDGIDAALDRLTATDGWLVAVVSGRSLDDLHRFAFHADVTVVGSHGMETHGVPLELTPAETDRFQRLEALADDAVESAGAGAWAEVKPASIAVHVREADGESARHALDRLAGSVGDVDGASSIAGSAVLEVFARAAGKGGALRSLRERHRAATTVFVGDDVTDEHAFEALEPGDVAVKVGDDPTIAAHRLPDPAAVLTWLRALAAPDVVDDI
ncbi:MAG: trehalose-phosphatase [Acidimicrobiia bacterium]|nr:trehalose-phosphatase [Acidimicrobiia bacterium]